MRERESERDRKRKGGIRQVRWKVQEEQRDEQEDRVRDRRQNSQANIII